MKYKVLIGFNYCSKADRKKRAKGDERVKEHRCNAGDTIDESKLKTAGVLNELVAAGAVKKASTT